MKKIFSVAISVCLLLALVVIPTNAGYVYEYDKSNNFSYEIDFEEGSHTMYYHFYQGLITWKVNRDYSYSYYPGGYGNPNVDNAPAVTGSDPNSVTNNSVYTLHMERTANQGWAESGGQVMNVSTANGYAPIILQNGVKYRISFDYFVESTYETDSFKDQDGNSKTNSGEDSIIIGYGYTYEGVRASKPVTEIGKIFSYNKNTHGEDDGLYTGDHGITRNIGNWYHAEYEFTPTGMTEFDYNGVGDVTAETGAPFLIMYHTFRYGTSVHFDNIKVSQEVRVNVNPIHGEVGTGYTSGFCGDKIELNGAAIRDGFSVEGWYYDGAYTRPVEDNKFTADLHGKTIYPKWRKSSGSKFVSITDFENYSSPLSNGGKFETATFSGTNVMKYELSTSFLGELFGNSDRTGEKNRFFVTTIDSLTAGRNYRITFKYYLESGSGVTVYPVFSDYEASTSTNLQKYDGEDLSGNNSWQEATFTITVNSDVSENLWLHIHATEYDDTVAYIDDIKVEDFGTLTVNANGGTINGKETDTFDIDYDTSLDSLNIKNGDKIIEGFYYNGQKVTTFDSSLDGQTVVVEWTDIDDLENYRYGTTLKNGFVYGREFASSGRYALKAEVTGEDTAVAGIKKAERRATYIVNFKYFAADGTKAKISAGTIEFDENHTTTYYGDFAVEINGASGGWKEATVAYTENAAKTGNIVTALFVNQIGDGNSTVYIDDVKVIKVADTDGFVIYDTMSHNGNATYDYGAKQTALNKPTTAPEGYTLSGWYTDKGLTNSFADTVITGKVKVYGKFTVKSSSVGDINADGAINVADYGIARQYILGIIITINNSAADMNGDGAINAIDLVLMLKDINA